MKTLLKTATALSAAAFVLAAGQSRAEAAELTLCWAAWDPANALVELSKDFEAQTGTTMKFEFVPWPNFADRMLNELNSGGKLCDLLIGDSQWIGGSAENGYYVKLNDFFDKEGIKMSDFAPATVYAYSTWPKGTPNYWALPAMGDANGWFYRKDWFEKPELMAEYKAKYNRDLAPPKTWDELKEIAEFFQGREIDGKKVYGAAIFTERASEGITMGATSALYPYGFKYEMTPGKYDMEGAVNSADAVAGLEKYKEIYKCCTPPGYTDSYMGEGLDAFKSGQVAMMMNWFAFMPGMAKDETGRREDRLLRQPGPEGRGLDARRPGHLGRRQHRQHGRRARLHQVVRPAGRAEEVVVARRLCLPQRGAERSGLQGLAALRGAVPRSHGRRAGLLAGARLCLAAAGHAEADCTTMSSPTRARPRRRSTG